MARFARAVPLEAIPLANAPSARRSTVPSTWRSMRGRAPASSALPVTVIGLPSESHRNSSTVARRCSSRSLVGTTCLNGTPASVNDASSSTTDAFTCSSDSAPASAVMVNAIAPSISRSCSAPTKGASTLGVMPVTRADSDALAGSRAARRATARTSSLRRLPRRPPLLTVRLRQLPCNQPPRHRALRRQHRLLPGGANGSKDDLRWIDTRIDDHVGGRRDVAVGDAGGAHGERAVRLRRAERSANGTSVAIVPSATRRASAGRSGPANATSSESGLSAVNRSQSSPGSAASDPASRARALCPMRSPRFPTANRLGVQRDRRRRLEDDASAVDDRVEPIEAHVSRRRHRLA